MLYTKTSQLSSNFFYISKEITYIQFFLNANLETQHSDDDNATQASATKPFIIL